MSATTRIRVIAALILRETIARYGAAPGGYLWAVAEPVGGVILLAAAFSFLVQAPPLGPSFLFFYATGLIPFLTFTSAVTSAMAAIQANRWLLAYPPVGALDCILARAILETLTSACVAGLVFAGLFLSLGLHLPFDPVAFAGALALALLAGVGVGTLNALLVGILPVWRQVWAVLSKPLFLVSGVLFTFDTLPPGLATFIWFNPVSHAIAEMRAAFYGPDQGLFVSWPYAAGLPVCLFVAAAALIERNEARLASG
jgi:capsular polysaccharide transport system permease protein